MGQSLGLSFQERTNERRRKGKSFTSPRPKALLYTPK